MAGQISGECQVILDDRVVNCRVNGGRQRFVEEAGLLEHLNDRLWAVAENHSNPVFLQLLYYFLDALNASGVYEEDRREVENNCVNQWLLFF